MKHYIISIFTVLTSLGLNAQEASAKTVQHKIGATVSTSTGQGFSYLANINDKHQIQITLLPLYFKNSDFFFGSSGSRFTNIIGLNYFRKIVNNDRFDILLFGGISQQVIMESYEEYILISGVATPTAVTEMNTRLNSTIGFAFEVGASDLCKLRWQVGYAAYNIYNNFTIAPSIGLGVDFLIK